MEEERNRTKQTLRFRDVLFVSAIALVLCMSGIVIKKTTWGNQVTWTELLVAYPIMTVLAVVASYYLMKKDEQEKK